MNLELSLQVSVLLNYLCIDFTGLAISEPLLLGKQRKETCEQVTSRGPSYASNKKAT
jgi:hypothetical protein